MKDGDLTNTALAPLLSEMREIRREVAEVHREMASAIVNLAQLLRELDSLKNCDQATREIVSGIAERLSRHDRNSHGHGDTCPNCGSRLQHHPAEAGDLLICPCGWSEFVYADGEQDEARFAPLPPAGSAPSCAWTRL